MESSFQDVSGTCTTFSSTFWIWIDPHRNRPDPLPDCLSIETKDRSTRISDFHTALDQSSNAVRAIIATAHRTLLKSFSNYPKAWGPINLTRSRNFAVALLLISPRQYISMPFQWGRNQIGQSVEFSPSTKIVTFGTNSYWNLGANIWIIIFLRFLFSVIRQPSTGYLPRLSAPDHGRFLWKGTNESPIVRVYDDTRLQNCHMYRWQQFKIV
jgi:hypothetical protein